VRANWKLVWENNRECWHCNVNHPQYVKANYDNAPIDDAALKHEIEAQARAPRRVSRPTVSRSIIRRPHVRFHHGTAGVHQPHAAGGRLVSESVMAAGAPLMGGYSRATSHLRMRTMPNFWDHASSDHACRRVWRRRPPKDARAVQWLVREDAVEARTTGGRAAPVLGAHQRQDWDLCEKNQAV